MAEMSLDETIKKLRELAAPASVVTAISYLERLKRLEEDLFDKQHSQQWLSPSDSWQRANYLATGEDW